MKAVLDAIEATFDADEALVRSGRKVYFGLQGRPDKPIKPFVDVTVENQGAIVTFGADVEQYAVTFTAHTDAQRYDNAFTLKEDLIRVFDDVDMTDEDDTFHTVMCYRTGGSGPTFVDGQYQVELEYELSIERRTMVPAERGT